MKIRLVVALEEWQSAFLCRPLPNKANSALAGARFRSAESVCRVRDFRNIYWSYWLSFRHHSRARRSGVVRAAALIRGSQHQQKIGNWVRLVSSKDALSIGGSNGVSLTI